MALALSSNEVVFQSSELASKRTEFIRAARAGRALLRDKDGFGLVMLPRAQWEATGEISACAMKLIQTEVALSRTDVRPADLVWSWLAVFDADDQKEFVNEMRDALSTSASTLDLEAVRTCLSEWMTTAKSLSDPIRRAILTGPGDDEYGEVGSPA